MPMRIAYDNSGQSTDSAALVPFESVTMSRAEPSTTGELSTRTVYTPHATCSMDEFSNDIGSIVQPSKSVDQISSALDDLPNSKKYSLVYQHVPLPNILPT